MRNFLLILVLCLVPIIGEAQSTYRIRNPTVTAIQWTGVNQAAVEAFIAPATLTARSGFLIIDTADGRKYAAVNDWVTKATLDSAIDVMKAAEFTRAMEIVP